jgi:NAD(P)-dependent dehydrogenase (short-subunit alcohol dehydrogenase family)
LAFTADTLSERVAIRALAVACDVGGGAGVLEVWKTPAMIAQAAREVPLQRLGRPEEIAWAVVFAACDQARFMTGETIYVSGGPRVANRED